MTKICDFDEDLHTFIEDMVDEFTTKLCETMGRRSVVQFSKGKAIEVTLELVKKEVKL